MRKYIDLSTIYPKEKLVCETYTIEQFVLSEAQVRRDQMQGMFSGNGWMYSGLEANFPYIKLYYNSGDVMMSDTPMERNTNRHFVNSANGDVLIFGLGLGLIVLPLLDCDDVKSITVIELHQDLIDLVSPFLKKHDKHDKLTVVQGDCFEYHNQVPKEKKFDCVYGDIWGSISTDNYAEMKQLTKNWKYRINRNNPKSFIDHWLKDYLKHEAESERRSAYSYW